MLRLLFLFSSEIRASCNLFNVDCQTTGALLSLDASCHGSRNSSADAISQGLKTHEVVSEYDSYWQSRRSPLTFSRGREYDYVSSYGPWKRVWVHWACSLWVQDSKCTQLMSFLTLQSALTWLTYSYSTALKTGQWTQTALWLTSKFCT